MWGRFYKHSPEAPVAQTLQLHDHVWEHSWNLTGKLKTALKILSVGALEIQEMEKEY